MMVALANIVIGPIVIALIFGFIVGTRLHLSEENSFKFTIGAIIAIIVGGFIMAYDIGQFATYQDLPIATVFLATIFGVFIGSALLGGRAKGDH
ncbi:MAG: hypothetical protein IKS93_00585 [Methanobrevibacter sp.]|nr:hypothetical protein [Methanobrevibacter sp.]